MARPRSRLTRQAIDPQKVFESVSQGGAGAVAIFLGTVRDNSEEGAVKGIRYEAYAEMAERRMAEAEREARRRWRSVLAITCLHRVGSLRVGDVSVAVAASAPHRAEAFEACRYVIEAIKHDVPIWKKEVLAGGRTAWVGGTRLGRNTRAGKESVRRAKSRV